VFASGHRSAAHAKPTSGVTAGSASRAKTATGWRTR